MLAFFRQKGLSNILYGAIIVATILTFVIEFRPNASQRTASWSQTCVARVRGSCIDPKDFGAAYRMLMPQRSAETSRRMNLKRVALDGLIERDLLDDEAKRLGLAVTEDEVTDQLYDGFVRVSVPAQDPTVPQAILSETYQAYARAGLMTQEVAQAHFDDRDAVIPVDFRDPKTKAFDMKVYERQVRNISNRSTAEFREEQTRELLAAKMRDLIRDPIRVSDAEAWNEYARRYSTATVTWIPVKESWAARWAVDASPAAVADWAKDHAAEVDTMFEARKTDDEPKAGHVRHILVKLPYGASDDEKALAIAKLSWAADRIRSGEPFAEVARDTSDDTGSAMKGGDVGDKTDGFVRPFKLAADALKPGETTPGAVETQYGYHLITKDDPSKSADVQAQLKRSLPKALYLKAKATDAAKAVASSIGEALQQGKAPEAAIESAVSTRRSAATIEPLRVLPPPPPEADAGTSGEKRGSSVADAGAPADKPQASRALPVRRYDATTDADRPQVQTSTAFNRGGDPFAGLSPDNTVHVVDFAFSSKDGNVMSEPVRTDEGYVAVQLKDHKIATRDEFTKDGTALQQELVRAKRDEALSLYVRRLREQAKDAVKVDESYVREAKTDAGAGGPDDEDEY